VKHYRRRGWRGSLLGFTGAFALLIVSAYLLFKGNTRSDLPSVWWSIAVSGLAMLTAVASVLFPRR
jgi:lipid-A-disaccharide synthase-like uncharacterized protein